MLQKLFIQNYAIIDSLTIDFGPGLNIITGETGAGKSILAGALGLVLGNRADISVLFDKEKKCIVEAVFHGAAMGHTTDWLTANELDPGVELVIRGNPARGNHGVCKRHACKPSHRVAGRHLCCASPNDALEWVTDFSCRLLTRCRQWCIA
jgi:DNA repair ATPase RecN